MPQGICRLCQREMDLQLSHVVPSFVFRWLRESAANGFLRSTASPNLRVQDGPQRYWLCLDCETIIGQSEASFSTRLFHPYIAASGSRFRYGPWLIRFCVSISWRNLLLQLDNLDAQNFTDVQWASVEAAKAAWERLLRGETSNPGSFRQFLVPLDRIETSRRDLPPNINRYLMRAIDLDLCHDDQAVFTYSKLGRFLIIGFIREPELSRWRGGMVNGNEGAIEPRGYTLPESFGRYLFERASNVRAAMQALSPRQVGRIEQTIRANAGRLVGSDFLSAMEADLEMFGPDAFDH